MSTLQVSTAQITTITDGTNSTSTTNTIRGSAKAWVSFNGSGSISTNQTINGSYNVSTVFKNGTGTYTVNLTNAMQDATGVAIYTVGVSPGDCSRCTEINSLTTSTIYCQTGVRDGGNTLVDTNFNYVCLFR